MIKNRNEEVLSFLEELTNNNNKAWFDANRPRYENLRDYFKSLINEIISRIAQFDNSIVFEDSKSSIFRINKDIRFSKDKTPYKTNFGAYIVPGGRKSSKAGYYLHLDNQGCFLAGGVYHPMPESLNRLRWAIYQQTNDFLSIIQSNDFIQTFGKIEGDTTSRLPREFSKDFEYPDLIKFKDYNVMYYLSADDIKNADFVDFCLNIFEKAYPFNLFINNALIEI